ncbi:MAG: S-layer homology domain-containing protein [Actinobacteria bacterium]|nr:S-layer homology domain-containing protein [Actinomycetota bacterium]
MKRSIIGWAAVLLLAAVLLSTTTTEPAHAQPSTFPDVEETDAAFEAIEALAAQGVVHGFTDGAFRPDEPLTRAQAAKMLVIWQDLPLPSPNADAPSPFSDVDTAYETFVAAAAAAGWVNGFPDGSFRPHTHLTREQMAVITIRSLALDEAAEDLSEQQVDNALDQFLDEGVISPKARPEMALAVMKAVFNGDGDRLNPLSPLTRAQFSLVLYRAGALAQDPVSDQAGAAPQTGGESEQASYTPEQLQLAAFMDTCLFRPHQSPITGEMVLQNAEWYGIPPLSQLVIMAAETSLGDPKLGGTLARHNNFGCLRYHGATTPWGLLSDGRVWAAGKDWYSFPTPQVGMAAFGRYLKAGLDGFYAPILAAASPDWERFAALYYGRSVGGFSSYVKRLNAIERSFRAEAAEYGVSF